MKEEVDGDLAGSEKEATGVMSSHLRGSIFFIDDRADDERKMFVSACSRSLLLYLRRVT